MGHRLSPSCVEAAAPTANGGPRTNGQQRTPGPAHTLSVMEINGTPLHPLVIHAVVVFVPLAAIAAIALAIPKYRWLARWPALVLTLGATAATYVAKLSGRDL